MKAADARAFGPRCAADGGFKPREGRVGSGPLALSLRGPGGFNPGGTPRRLKACGLSLCGCRHIFIRKNQGLKICKQFSGPAFFDPRRGNAAQAQDLRSFAMWLSPHIHPEKYRPENPQAASRPVFFGMTARLVEKIKNPLTTGRRSDNV